MYMCISATESPCRCFFLQQADYFSRIHYTVVVDFARIRRNRRSILIKHRMYITFKRENKYSFYLRCGKQKSPVRFSVSLCFSRILI